MTVRFRFSKCIVVLTPFSSTEPIGICSAHVDEDSYGSAVGWSNQIEQ